MLSYPCLVLCVVARLCDGLVEERTRVVIIGGGAAGIAAAEQLNRGGEEDFVVLEAEQRVGGRVCSKKVGEGEEIVEWGAQFIHGEEGNVAYELAEEWGLVREEDLEWGDMMLERDDNTTVDVELMGLMYTVMSGEGSIEERMWNLSPEEAAKYESEGEYFTASLNTVLEEKDLLEYKEEAAQYMAWHGRSRGTENGAPSWWDMPAQYPWEECPGNQMVVLKKGTNYQAFLERLGENVMDRVKLGEKVVKVSREEDKVEVETETTRYLADYVIITVSLGVLKHGGIEFVPALPQAKLEVINDISFGVVAKLFLEYDTEIATLVPNLGLMGISFLRKSEGSSTNHFKNTPSDPWEDNVMGIYPDIANPRLLLMWLSGPAALQAEQLSAPSLLGEVKTLLARFLPISHPLLVPISAYTTKWGTGVHTKGSYSYTSTTMQPNSRDLLAQPVERLLFAGEATHSSHYSTVHGAMETGRREADRILGTTKRNTSQTVNVGWLAWLAQIIGWQ